MVESEVLSTNCIWPLSFVSASSMSSARKNWKKILLLRNIAWLLGEVNSMQKKFNVVRLDILLWFELCYQIQSRKGNRAKLLRFPTALLLVAFAGCGWMGWITTDDFLQLVCPFLLLIEVMFDHLGGQLVQHLLSPCIPGVAVCNFHLMFVFDTF